MLARRTLAAALAATLTLALAASADARTRLANEWRPIVYVHGFEQDGAAECTQWTRLHNQLEAWGGFDQPMATIGYYADDGNCTYWSHHHGSHSMHHDTTDSHRQAAASTETGHTTDAPIEHLAHHFAWTVYDHFTAGGRTVDVVAHSMGGLISRYALEKVERGDPDFPPTLRVDDIVTLGTPHSEANFELPTHYQSDQMQGDSAFMTWVRTYALHPQPHTTIDTDWTNVGSEDDNLVSVESATAMGSDNHKVRYASGQAIEHDQYHQLIDETWDYKTTWWSRQERWWHTWTAAPPPSGWTYFALCCNNR